MKTTWPKQKKKATAKGKAWRESHFEPVEDLLSSDDSPIRSSLQRKISNYRLYNGNATKGDYDMILNPSELNDAFIPDAIQHYPIARPYLNVLIGEEWDRRFEWSAILTNPNAISEKEKQLNSMLKNKLAELIQDSEMSEEQLQQEYKNYLNYLKYDYQDIREKRANLLLKHFIKELDLKVKFNEGFKNVLITGEEGYAASIINNRPIIEVLDPKKTYIVRSGYSNKWEDADVIISYDYISPGAAVDQYYENLKSTDVKKLDDDAAKKYGTNSEDELTLDIDEYGVHAAREEMFNDFLDLPGEDDTIHSRHSELVDQYGNVRRIRLYWKSYKEIKKIRYFDDFGNEQFRIANEFEQPNKELGEEAKSYWVSEWWEGVQIMGEIYPYIRPRQIQYNKFSDPGYNHPGIVGQIYNTGEMKTVSMMDLARPYQLLYDATMHRLTDALSKFFGAMPVVDYAWIPEGWNVKKWLYFARKAGIAVRDSFKEGNKGAATGKIAASVGNTSSTINQPLGDYIQQQINILNYIELQMGRIIGIPPQRLGDIANRETVGGIERAVTQSSFATNELFKIHDNVKKRVLTLLLETSKIAMKDNPQKFQHIGDDYLAQMFEVGDDIMEEEYGIVLSNENDITKMEQVLEQLAHAAIQNQTLKFSHVFQLFNSSSLAEKQKIIEIGEEEMMQRQEQMQQQAIQQQQAELQAKQQEEAMKAEMDMLKHRENLQMEKYKVDQQEATKRFQMGQDINKNNSEIEQEYNKLDNDLMLEMRKLDEEMRSNKANEKLEEKKIAAQKAAAAAKPKTST